MGQFSVENPALPGSILNATQHALLRSGLEVAVSVVERSVQRVGFKFLRDHLAHYALPGVPAAESGQEAQWPGRVRDLADVRAYMQATREMIALFAWLRRACRALGAESDEPRTAETTP